MNVLFITALTSTAGGFTIRDDETGNILGELDCLAELAGLVERLSGDANANVVVEVQNCDVDVCEGSSKGEAVTSLSLTKCG